MLLVCVSDSQIVEAASHHVLIHSYGVCFMSVDIYGVFLKDNLLITMNKFCFCLSVVPECG